MPPCYGFYSFAHFVFNGIFHYIHFVFSLSLIQQQQPTKKTNRFNWFKLLCCCTCYIVFSHSGCLILGLRNSASTYSSKFGFVGSRHTHTHTHQHISKQFHFRELSTENDSLISISLSLLRHNKNEDENIDWMCVQTLKQSKKKTEENNNNNVNQISHYVSRNKKKYNAVNKLWIHSKHTAKKRRKKTVKSKAYHRVDFKNAACTGCGLWAVWYTNNWHNTKLELNCDTDTRNTVKYFCYFHFARTIPAEAN